MKKLNLILITIFSVVGALLIYNYFEKHKPDANSGKKVTEEYNLVSDSILVYKNIDEINQIISNDSGIVFFCIKENTWCNYYASYLNDVATANGIKEIYYLDIKQDRQYNTSGYRKLVNSLENYLLKDDENNLKIFVPTVIFVKNGNILEYDNETSILTENITPNEYWTDEKISEFKMKITSFMTDYKEEK